MDYKNSREQPSLGETDTGTKHTQDIDTLSNQVKIFGLLLTQRASPLGSQTELSILAVTPQEGNDPQGSLCRQKHITASAWLMRSNG